MEYTNTDFTSIFGTEFDDLEFHFTCGVCFELLKEPVTLTCSHTLCKDCLTKIYRSNPQCPFCRGPVNVPLPSVNEVLRNLALRWIDEVNRRNGGETDEDLDDFYEQSESFLMSLPDEILFDILGGLDATTLARITSVCKELKPLVEDNWLWKSLTEMKWPFCNAEEFSSWKACFQANATLSVGWERGRSKDFKMTPLRGHTSYVTCFSLYRNNVISGSHDNNLLVWKTNQKKPITTLEGHVNTISSVKFNESWVLSGSHGSDINVWDTTTGINVYDIRGANDGRITDIIFDEHEFMASSTTGWIKSYDLRSGEMTNDRLFTNPVTTFVRGNNGVVVSAELVEVMLVLSNITESTLISTIQVTLVS
eukprot:TRINITY_DN10939_c0_g1_i2.p1 TRINITY_DN10939_c0_g1~~TRINITY_DN10939_c0_g1_i2.p1  ORF type:complete len:366 (+),score=70.92 TRINITY_DN10939_c0_g1_i2:49-1146(+)